MSPLCTVESMTSTYREALLVVHVHGRYISPASTCQTQTHPYISYMVWGWEIVRSSILLRADGRYFAVILL
jgi:hypothetical protein